MLVFWLVSLRGLVGRYKHFDETYLNIQPLVPKNMYFSMRQSPINLYETLFGKFHFDTANPSTVND
jgi:hypothetical protein